MAQRSYGTDIGFDVNISELAQSGLKHVVASVHDTKKEAEVEALSLRLSGKQAFIQNGLQGKYEVLSTEREIEVRKLDASFKEVGTGVYIAGSPAWDKGSVWTLYKTEQNGEILVSKMEDEDEDSREALTAKIQVKSNINARTAAANVYLPVGETLEFIDIHGRFATGRVTGLDYSARCYTVISDISFEEEFIPFTLTASDMYSEDANADDEFVFTPEQHSEEAYTSENANADDDYSQNMPSVSGFEAADSFDHDFDMTFGEDLVEASTDEDDLMEIKSAFQFDFDGFDQGLDDTEQLVDDLQPSVDHYDFDPELYSQASLEDQDIPQTLDDLQSQTSEVDFSYTEADQMNDELADPNTDQLQDLNEVINGLDFG